MGGLIDYEDEDHRVFPGSWRQNNSGLQNLPATNHRHSNMEAQQIRNKYLDNDSDVLYYVTVDELFEVIHTAHLTVGHGGRNRTMAVLKTKYCNVTTEAVMGYLGLCSNCQVKQSNPKRGLVTKPILHSAFNSRAQIDLIDMQSQNYNNYRYIMNYQDHLKKFVILKPLKTKRAEEIALNLIDIYTIFGAPAILHSDNGREFVNYIITNLNEMWGDIKIVHGKPRHSQTQGSIERGDVWLYSENRVTFSRDTLR
ncbi:KRAB-A domain-containing protein 2-like [Metopolophium dirhodum]|uniref:KRAB-A domain-containing protein 2-like n=1 Tax=Metopolophium dirhodum TaxID=44670 RepID=UPI00298FE39E|nr:KRAB-A domain-containing protein 2-like [Metopolophium dirhodum]